MFVTLCLIKERRKAWTRLLLSLNLTWNGQSQHDSQCCRMVVVAVIYMH